MIDISPKTGLVFDIQRFSISDGPGVRTTVFLKGCNLRCRWCHNPESQDMRPELRYTPRKCIGCGTCVAACPTGAHSIAGTVHRFERARCMVCGACATACSAEALEMAGRPMTVDQIVGEVVRDIELYHFSGGGMTASGGEPLLQPDFLTALLGTVQAQGIATAVETAGCVPYANLAAILPCTDLFLYDWKAFGPETHRACTGVSNGPILDNLRRLSAAGARIFLRLPLAAGINDGLDDARAALPFIASLAGVEQVELLAYHSFGEGKYATLGRRAELFHPPAGTRLKELAALYEKTGKPVVIRGA